MKSRRILGGLAVAGLAGAVTVVVLRHHPEPPRPAPVAAATVRLERRDLSTTTSLPGTIGYGAARPLAGHLDATVTWLPAVGSTIKRGQQLYRADDRPVPLFYGGLPLFRPIDRPNMTGRDVAVIAANLSALGYDTGRRSSVLTPALTGAIKRWQKDAELPPTGTIAVGDVEVQAAAVRVDGVSAQPGSPANAPLLTVTSTRKVVTVPTGLDAAGTIDRGERVTVKVGDRPARAHVVSVGRDLVTPDATDGSAPKLTVTVSVDDPKTVSGLDSAEVTVDFPGRVAKGVLAAPIEALVALTEGGYAVQGPAGLVPVKTGMFADGWVQITGPGLAAGTEVVVSS